MSVSSRSTRSSASSEDTISLLSNTRSSVSPTPAETAVALHQGDRHLSFGSLELEVMYWNEYERQMALFNKEEKSPKPSKNLIKRAAKASLDAMATAGRALTEGMRVEYPVWL